MDIFANAYLFWTVLIVSNVLMYLVTICISYLWSRLRKQQTLALTRADLKTSLLVVVVNIAVAIPGYLLFNAGEISFTTDSFFLDFLFLFIGFDVAMYVLHYISHTVWPFTLFHKDHHAHKYFNAISLYVMHPLESFLFGGLMTISVFLFDVNLYSFLGFIVFNWLYGVVGHLNTTTTESPKVFGNAIFHKAHHVHSNCNYGFYTVFMDRLFGTYR